MTCFLLNFKKPMTIEHEIVPKYGKKNKPKKPADIVTPDERSIIWIFQKSNFKLSKTYCQNVQKGQKYYYCSSAITRAIVTKPY